MKVIYAKSESGFTQHGGIQFIMKQNKAIIVEAIYL